MNDNTVTTSKSFTNKNQASDCKSKVHFSEEQVPSYVSGEREPITVRIDRGVYKRFKPIAKRVFGSTCKAVETSMISIIEATEKGVHFCDTSKPITIEKLVIERNLSRERRNLKSSVDLEVRVEAEPVSLVCVDCGKVAYARAIDGEGCRLLCRRHFDRVKSRLVGWKVLQ